MFVADTAVNACHTKVQVFAEHGCIVFDLDRKLSCRRDDKGAATLIVRIASKELKDSDQEGGGLAGTRLGLYGDVSLLETMLEGLFLDFGTLSEAGVIYTAL